MPPSWSEYLLPAIEDPAHTLIQPDDHRRIDGFVAAERRVKTRRQLRHRQLDMRQGPGRIQEEGATPVLLDEVQRAFDEEIVAVHRALAAGIARDADRRAVVPQRFRVMAVGQLLVEVAEEVVEALALGLTRRALVAQSPFPDSGRGVADGPEHFGDDDIALVQRHPAIGGGHFGRGDASIGPDAGMPVVLAGHEDAARGGADRSTAVEIGEPHPLGRHAVEVRRAVALLAVAAQLRRAEVVGQDQHHVGRALRWPGRRRFGCGRGAGRSHRHGPRQRSRQGALSHRGYFAAAPVR